MPQHSLGVLEASVTHIASGTLVHPSAIGPNQVDLLHEFDEYLKWVGSSGGVAIRERFMTVVGTSQSSFQRARIAEFDYGRYGSHRRVHDVSTGRKTGDVRSGEAASDSIRVAMAVPINATFALIAHEIVARATIGTLFSNSFEKWFQERNGGFSIKFDYLEDADAWQEYLDGADLKSLSFAVYRTPPGDRTAPPRREVYEVDPGYRGEVLPHSWLDRIRSRSLNPGDVMNVPVDPQDVEEIKVVVDRHGQRRTLVLESSWPRFTWEIDPGSIRRPTDTRFREFAFEILTDRVAKRGSSLT